MTWAGPTSAPTSWISSSGSRSYALRSLPTSESAGRPLTFADIGCGSAAQSFECAAKYEEAWLIDVPNLAQRFLTWRAARHDLPQIHATGFSALEGRQVDVMVSLDVLEHIAASSDLFMQMDRLIPSGGMLLLRTPWASIVPHPEHLPEAEEDWFKPDGGAELLRERYTRVLEVSHGGLYRKK